MPPYNIEVVSPAGPGPSNGNAILDSLNTRNKFMAPPSSSRHNAVSGNNAQTSVRRPQADMPSSSSSGSWAAQVFPHSHPRNQQSRQQPPQPAAPQSLISGMGNSIVSASIHPHIRELVERQHERDLQKQAYVTQQLVHQQHQQQPQPQSHQFQHPKLREMHNQEHRQQQDDVNLIRGLHMNHVLNVNEQQHQEYNDQFVSNHPLSPPLNSPMNQGLPPHLNNGQAQQLSPRSFHQQQHQPLPVNTVDEDGDYVIEGTFQQKGCVCQTADDVGYLFGCGTKPQDEVVYVYNTQVPKPEDGPHAAQANNTPRGAPVNQNVNDVLFQIDKEYQAMQAHHEGNMGFNNTSGHGEFLRDPPPGATLPRYRVVQEDDEYAKTSCSLSGIMDLILPGNRRKKQSRGQQHSSSHRALCGLSPRMSPRRGVFGDYSNYPSDREARNKRRPRPVSMSNSNDDDQTTSSFDKAFAKFGSRKKIVKNASDGVSELQNQLKALVQERAMNKGSPSDSPKETRQEPSPPVSPMASSDDDTTGAFASKSNRDVAKSSSTEKEMSRIRKEKKSLDQARENLKVEMEQHEQKQSLDEARNMLKLELAQHEQKMQEQKLAAAQYGMAGNAAVGLGVGGVGMLGSPTVGMGGGVGMVGSPTVGMGVSPMVLSPLTAQSAVAPTPMMVTNPAVTLQQPAMQQMNGMVMNGGMWQQQMNNGMIYGQNNGIGNVMGNVMNNGMGNGMMGTAGQTGALQQAEKVLQQTSGYSVAQRSVAPHSVAPHSAVPDARSVMDKSMYSMGQSTMHKSMFSRGRNQEGKFIDNVGVYPTRHRVSPKGSPPQSRPATSNHTYNGEEYTQSSQMLNDLKVKNETIRQDISRMKNVIGNKGSPRSGGVNVAGNIRKAGQSASRPFPRTSPPSSPSNRHGMHGDPVARAMQRSDDARSIASTSLKGRQGYRASSSPRYGSSRAQSRGHDRQPHGTYGGDGVGGYEYSRRQPPSPMRTTRQRDQEYYHV